MYDKVSSVRNVYLAVTVHVVGRVGGMGADTFKQESKIDFIKRATAVRIARDGFDEDVFCARAAETVGVGRLPDAEDAKTSRQGASLAKLAP